MKYKIKNKCLLCGSTKSHTERGTETCTFYDNGKRIRTVTRTDKNWRQYCDNCYEEIGCA